jgi:uncharacterized protein YukE
MNHSTDAEGSQEATEANMADRRSNLARRADNLAEQLERDLGNVGDAHLAGAVRDAAAAMRALGDACRGDDDEQFDRALDDSSAALNRCATRLAEVEQRPAE